MFKLELHLGFKFSKFGCWFPKTGDTISPKNTNEAYSLTRPMHRRTDANLYPPERQLTKVSEPSFDLERRGPRSNLTTSEDSQPMISYKLVSQCKPLGPIIREI